MTKYKKVRPPGGKTKRGTPRLRKPGGGRPPATGVVHMLTTGDSEAYVRISFSEDVIDKLVEMHAAVFGAFTMAHRLNRNYTGLRIQFARLVDMSIPAVFVRIEPPTWDPKGKRLWRPPHSRRLQVTIACSKIGVRPGVKPAYLEQMYHESMPGVLGGGMILNFPDDYMMANTAYAKGADESLIVD